MSNVDDVISEGMHDVREKRAFYWGPQGSPGMHLWARNMVSLAEVGQRRERAISCFEYVLFLAARANHLTKTDYLAYFKDLQSRERGTEARAFAKRGYWGVWKDWRPLPGFTNWSPRKGDIVFFATGTDLIHVALASGTTNAQVALEVISFEGAGRDQANWVVLDTIDALKQKYKATSVKFAEPFWA